jgi:CheY-like chemotaxis protein
MSGVLEGRRILIIDDDVSTAELLAELLMISGAETALAHDGASAVVEVERFTPQLAVVDIELGDTNGYELAGRLHERAPALKLVALTGHGDLESRARSEAAGFAAHVTKPIDAASLIRLLASLG